MLVMSMVAGVEWNVGVIGIVFPACCVMQAGGYEIKAVDAFGV